MARPAVDRAARRVDVEADVLGRILGGEHEQLGADQVGAGVIDLGPEEDDALLEQAPVDIGGPVEWPGLSDCVWKRCRHEPTVPLARLGDERARKAARLNLSS